MSTEDYNRLRGYGVPGPNGTLNSKTPGNPAPDNTDKSSDALSLGHAGRVFAYVWSSCAAAYSRVCGYHNTDKSSDAYADFFGLIPAALAGASENGGVPAVPTDEVLTTESGLPKNPAPVNHPEDAWVGYIDPAFYQLANSVTTRRGAAQGYPDDQSLVPHSVAYDFRLGVSRPNLSENLKAVKVLLSVPDIREAITSAGWTVSPEIEQFLDEVQFASNAQGTEGPVNAVQEGTPIFSDLMADYAVISIGQGKPGFLRINITRNSWEGYYDFRARIDQRISDLKLTYHLVARDITVQYRSNPTESSMMTETLRASH